MTNYIVYQRTSPSGNCYIGYTKQTLMERWKQTQRDLENATTPLAHAIRKYGVDTWTHTVLFETNNKQLALDMEVKYINERGYYNLAKGGTGGNTGRNHEPEKIKKQAKSLSNHWKQLSQEEKDRRIDANVASRKLNGTSGNNNPRYGIEHGNHTGLWVCAGVEYVTLADAVIGTGANQSSIIDLCVKRVDKPTVGRSKYITKGKTPRECGWYKRKKHE